MIRVYRLSPLGSQLSHNTNNPDTPEWRVIHYLGKVHTATRDELVNLSGVSSMTLAKLRIKGILAEEGGVEV